jgi:hypothetical protein
MEACWLASGLWLAERRAAAGTLPVGWVLAGLPAAFALWRLTRGLGRRLQAGVGIGAGLVWTLAVVLIADPQGPAPIDPGRLAAAIAALGTLAGGAVPGQLAAAAAAAAWACGIRVAAKPIDLEGVLAEFQLGLLVFLIVLFCAAQWDLALGRFTPAVVVFFLSFLCGAAVSQGLARGGWLHGSFRGPWLAVVAGHAALALGAGALLAAAVTPEALALVLAGLGAVWDAVTDLLAALMAFLARILPQPDMGVHPPFGGGGGGAPEPGNAPDLWRIPDLIRSVVQFLVAGLWAGLFGLALWRIAGQVAAWLRRQAAGGDGAEIEVISGALGDDLRRVLRWLQARLSRWLGRLRRAIGRGGPAKRSSPGAASVERIYRRLLAWSAAGGCRRGPEQTPREFLARLVAWLPEAGPDLERITAAFERVSYGAETPTAETIAGLALGLRNVRRSKPRGHTGTRAHRGTTPGEGRDG